MVHTWPGIKNKMSVRRGEVSDQPSDQYSLYAQLITVNLSFLHAVSEDSDHVEMKPKLIGVFS